MFVPSSVLRPAPLPWVVFCLFLLTTACEKKEDEILPVFEPETESQLQSDQWFLNGEGGRLSIQLTDTRYRGEGVLVAIIDDGLDLEHEDLRENIAAGSYNYYPAQEELSSGKHGTACAGIIAAAADNGVGIRGIAPGAKLVAYNAITGAECCTEFTTDALRRDVERIWISNNSWLGLGAAGTPSGMPAALRQELESALRHGVENGRHGKGTVYVFSTGNVKGVYPNATTNSSVLTNNRYAIAVGAVDDQGRRAAYSVDGATLLVCAPSGSITTTDLTNGMGYNPTANQSDYVNQNYTRNFGLTSAAAPMVSGVAALMLEANPDLGWRDVRAILARSAFRTDTTDPGWSRNGAGRWINPKYGFGVIHADAAIVLAENWQNLGPEQTVMSPAVPVDRPIPDDNAQGVSSTVEVAENLTIEFVEVFIDIDHPSTPDLEIVLTSPAGTESVLTLAGADNDVTLPYSDWRYGSIRCLDEDSAGEWRLTVRDRVVGSTPGRLKSWSLVIYGH